jgi:hypothetical protein
MRKLLWMSKSLKCQGQIHSYFFSSLVLSGLFNFGYCLWFVLLNETLPQVFKVLKVGPIHISGCCMGRSWDILAHQTSSWLPSCHWSVPESQHCKYYWVYEMQKRCGFSCTIYVHWNHVIGCCGYLDWPVR